MLTCECLRVRVGLGLFFFQRSAVLCFPINLILEDRIVFIQLSLAWGDARGLYEAFPELFELREDNILETDFP